MIRRCAALASVLLFCLLFQSACDRQIDSKDPVRSLPESPPRPINLTARLMDRAVDLSWEVSDSATVDRFRIYQARDSLGTYSLIDSSNAFSIVLTGLPLQQPIALRVTSVSAAGLESPRSEPVTVTVGLLRILIDDGDEYTRDRYVQIRISTPVLAAYVEFSEDPDLSDAVVREFRESMSFDLSPGDGLKTVYARLTFGDGTEAGELLSDQIILDTEARIDSVYFTPVGQILSAGDTAYFYLAAHGETGGNAQVSFPGVTRVRLNDVAAEGDQVPDDGVYSSLWVVPVGLTVSEGVVNGAFTDAAGNAAPGARAAELLNIRTSTPPTAVNLAVGLVDTATAHLSWTENADDDFESYRVYRSVSPGIVVTNDFLTIAIMTARGGTTHDDYLSSPGTYYYRVFVFDAEGLTAGSNEVAVTR